ncbi:MAG: YjgP/YjgQ family permease [Candidatus Omnitrophica bacterium]|nr:YjgP/YjgQ family permease [Candidatus Omnitrophota bacterium]
MKVLDRYMVRELLKPLILSCAVLIALVLIADLFNNLDDFLRYKLSLGMILKYYGSLVPASFVQILPWAAWLGTLFLLVTFGFNNEIIAMKAAGLQITMIVRPIIFLGFLLGILSFLVSDRIIPKTYRIANELKEVQGDKKKNNGTGKQFKNVTYLSRSGQLYYFRTFSGTDNSVRDAIGLWLDPEEKNTRRKVIAKKGIWENERWIFEDVTEYHMDSRGRVLGEPKMFSRKTYAEIDVTPKDLKSVSSNTTSLNYRELKESIHKLKENGIHANNELVDLHYRLASPWQPLVMMLICVPLLAKTTNRKLIAVNVLICVGLVFAFNVVGAIAIALGKAEKVMPFVGAWAGNIIFGIAGLFTLEKANY